MLKAYLYKESDLSIGNWPPGLLRLDPVQETPSPEEADVFVVPPGMHVFPRDQVRSLKYLSGREERHVLFHCSDFDTTYGLKCMFIQCNLKRKMLDVDVNSISWPWPVKNLVEISGAPEGGFKYDISFHGWMSGEVRRISIKSCTAQPGIRGDWAIYPDFYGYVERDNPQEAARRRSGFLKSVHESRLVLAPRSIDGVFPYRFWEGMSAGRVTIMVGSNYNLPWRDKIDWDRCIIQVPESEMARTGEVVKKFLSTHTDEQILEMGRYGREMWLRWMDPDKWAQLMTEAVVEKLLSFGWKSS